MKSLGKFVWLRKKKVGRYRKGWLVCSGRKINYLFVQFLESMASIDAFIEYLDSFSCFTLKRFIDINASMADVNYQIAKS